MLMEIFTILGWKTNTICKRAWVLLKESVTVYYLLLARDDILYMPKIEELLNELLDRSSYFF